MVESYILLVWPVIAQSLEFKPARSVIGSSAAAGEDTTR